MSESCNPAYILRIMKDFQEFYKEKTTSLFIAPEENNICLVHALIIGPKETPYENGFFYFVLRLPCDYPLSPPKVELKTTHNKTVRFNPNLYSCGKVCLSTLGTWSGPPWSPALTIFSTLLSIQSLMNEQPYHNEPGFEKTNSTNSTDVNDYNSLITHETLRVAVIEMLQEKSIDAAGMPTALKSIMKSYFSTHYQFYENLIRSNEKLDGQPVRDPFRDFQRPQTFSYKNMLKKIVKLKVVCSENGDTSSPHYCQITQCNVDSNGFMNEPTQCIEESNDFMNESAEMDESILYESESDCEEDWNEDYV